MLQITEKILLYGQRTQIASANLPTPVPNRSTMVDFRGHWTRAQMKTTILYTIAFLTLLVFVCNAFPQENTRPIIAEELCGSWVNKGYDQTEKHVRWDFYQDGTWASYRTLSSEAPQWKGSYIVSDKWTDSKKNTWFKVFWHDTIAGMNG